MKVENKFYVEDKEVVLVADKYSTKIYKADNNYYVTNYDEVVAVFKDAEIELYNDPN